MSQFSTLSKGSSNQHWNHILKELEDETDLDIVEHIDEIETTNYKLPKNVPAATKNTRKNGNYKSKILFDSKAKYLPKKQQEEIAIHEAIHALDHKNHLIPELEKTKDISTQFRKHLQKNLLYGNREIKEGTTQLLTTQLADSNNSYFYPYETNKVNRQLAREGIDVESELADQIENFEEQLLDEYTQVYDISLDEGIYSEEGLIGNQSYVLDVYDQGIAIAYLEDREREEDKGYLEG